jgi:hypothetical protein
MKFTWAITAAKDIPRGKPIAATLLLLLLPLLRRTVSLGFRRLNRIPFVLTLGFCNCEELYDDVVSDCEEEQVSISAMWIQLLIDSWNLKFRAPNVIKMN